MPIVLWHGKRHLPYISLTFDDCYNYSLIQDLERLLDTYPAFRVTFFPTGTALINTSSHDPELWSRLLEKGHEIGYHGYDHEYPSKLSTKQLLSDFDKWLEAATQVLGKEPTIRFARPPYGDRSYSFPNLCVERNLIVAMWSTNWGNAPERAHREMARMQAGDIALLHIRYWDIENTREALPLISESSLHAVTLSELYSASNYDQDTVKDYDTACNIQPPWPCPQ